MAAVVASVVAAITAAVADPLTAVTVILIAIAATTVDGTTVIVKTDNNVVKQSYSQW